MTSRTLNPNGAAPVTNVFEEMPELLAGVEPQAAAELSRIRAPVIEIERGPWTPPMPRARAERHFGLLVLDGLVLRRVTLERRSGAELLGSGDLLQPWALQAPYDTLPTELGWEVLEQTRMAVLDARFAARIAPWPEVAVALVSCVIERTRVLAFQHVASHIPGLNGRLLALFWALADRWGKVTREGVHVPLRLTHATLAQLVGASRPSVSTALAELARQGTLRREPGGWVLAASTRPEAHGTASAVANGHQVGMPAALRSAPRTAPVGA